MARSLVTLLGQVNKQAPRRSKASDGGIGNADHQTRDSDHNPWVGPAPDGDMIVTAYDFTHDPAGGFDAYKFAETLKARRDPRIKYVISNHRIWSLARNGEGWRPYTGPNGHTHHTHVSVSSTRALYDSTAAWSLGSATTPPKEEDDMTPAQASQLARVESKLDTLLSQEAARYQREELWNTQILAASKDDEQGGGK
jgi:hypothetical protein